MISLRPYQQRAIDDLRASYQAGRRAPCLVAPTGSGKTIIAAAIIEGSVTLGNRVLFVAHREELLSQTVRKLSDAGVYNVRLIRAAVDIGPPDAPVVVASVQTLTRRAALLSSLRPTLIVCDEAHHFVARTFAAIINAHPGALVLGLTATPERADGAPLGDMFDALVTCSSVQELTDAGHLVPCRIWAPPAELRTAEIVVRPVDAYLKHTPGQRAVTFCSTADHCARVVEEFLAAGVRAAVVSGSMATDLRRSALADFRAGTIRVLVCVHVLTEGWDDPGVTVGILARKPGHTGTFLQIAGRILRPAPGKTGATLLDLCGSSLQHGPPAMQREYSLDGRAISKVERKAIRQCPECGSVYLSATTGTAEDGTPCCPACGCLLPVRATAKLRVVGGELVEVAPFMKPMRERPIVAKYPGTCFACSSAYQPGTTILWATGRRQHRHADCARRCA